MASSPSETPTSPNSTPPQPHPNSLLSSSPQHVPNSTVVSSPLPLPSSPFSSSTSSSSDEFKDVSYPPFKICSDPPPSPTTEQIREVQRIEMKISKIQADVATLKNRIAEGYDSEEDDVILNAKLTEHLDELEEKLTEAYQESEKKREKVDSLEIVTVTSYNEFDAIFSLIESSSTKIWIHESTPEMDLKCIMMEVKEHKKEYGLETRVIVASKLSEEELLKDKKALFDEKFPDLVPRSPELFDYNKSSSSDGN